ncbi:MATE family multidrug resistance protein [Crenobacter luteus]|uniref:MATE family efflux transporter n=1 Tax=Crenobacter luteus TaxID=1452487 RepID=UPI00104DAB8C|nr:MATE family efflux transporter [Crenobacter luteus]TCP14494.1 MATE family multidrug resistance protein [Crenobacter luteus]
MLFELHRTPRRDIAREAGSLIRLALPMMIAQIAQVATGFVDMVMAGAVGTDDLAAVSLGASVFIMAYVTLMGVVSALNPILSHLLGAGRVEQIGATGRQGLWFGFLLGLAGMAAMLATRPVLTAWLPLPAHVTAMVDLYIVGAALGMPAAMTHRALHAYASSLNRPRPIMFMSLICLALNVPLNYVLIHGLFGLPALGGAGCGWATGIVFWINALLLGAYIARHPHFAPFGLFRRFDAPDFARLREFFKLGAPIGLSFFTEVSLFSLIALLVARFGTVVVASHQAVLNVSSIAYMIPQSLAVAVSVRVGQAGGAGDWRRARFVSGVGLLVGLAGALITMAVVMGWRHEIIGLYSDDARVLALGAGLLVYSAVFQLVDATQTVASGALRGYKLTAVPMLIHTLTFWGVGLGLGVTLGLTDWLAPAMGVYGFWSALVVSLIAAAALLVAYLAFESRRRLARHTVQGNA